MKKYAKLEICRVKDFCDDERTFYSDSNGIMYSDMETLANYFYDSKEIALNHIRVSKMPCADSEFVKNIDILTDRMCEIEKKIDAIKLQAIKNGIPYSVLKRDFSAGMFGRSCIEMFQKNDIFSHPLTDGACSIYLIRRLEFQNLIKRILIHEIGHAIADQYYILNDQGIASLFQKYTEDFEDEQEFLAECFVATEYSNNIEVAKKVRGIINKYTGVWD